MNIAKYGHEDAYTKINIGLHIDSQFAAHVLPTISVDKSCPLYMPTHYNTSEHGQLSGQELPTNFEVIMISAQWLPVGRSDQIYITYSAAQSTGPTLTPRK